MPRHLPAAGRVGARPDDLSLHARFELAGAGGHADVVPARRYAASPFDEMDFPCAYLSSAAATSEPSTRRA